MIMTMMMMVMMMMMTTMLLMMKLLMVVMLMMVVMMTTLITVILVTGGHAVLNCNITVTYSKTLSLVLRLQNSFDWFCDGGVGAYFGVFQALERSD